MVMIFLGVQLFAGEADTYTLRRGNRTWVVGASFLRPCNHMSLFEGEEGSKPAVLVNSPEVAFPSYEKIGQLFELKSYLLRELRSSEGQRKYSKILNRVESLKKNLSAFWWDHAVCKVFETDFYPATLKIVQDESFGYGFSKGVKQEKYAEIIRFAYHLQLPHLRPLIKDFSENIGTYGGLKKETAPVVERYPETLKKALIDQLFVTSNFTFEKDIKSCTKNVIKEIAFTRNGDFLITASSDGVITIWRVDNGVEWINQFGSPIKSSAKRLASMGLNPCNNMIAVGDHTGGMFLLDKQGLTIASSRSHDSSVNAIAFSLDGTIIASGSDDTTIVLYGNDAPSELSTAKWVLCTKKVLKKHLEGVTSLAFNSSNQLLSGARDGYVLLWDCLTGECLKEFATSKNGWLASPVYAVAFSPDGKFFGYTKDSAVVVRKCDSGEVFNDLSVLNATAVRFAFDKTGTRIVCGGGDDVLVYEVGYQHTSCFKYRKVKHKGAVSAVAWSPSEDVCFTGDAYGGIKLLHGARKRFESVNGRSLPTVVQVAAFISEKL